MMKYFILSLLLSFLSLIAHAQDFQVDGIYYNVTSLADLTCEVSKVPENSAPYYGDIIIPATVSGLDRTFTVTGVGPNAFAQNYISDSQLLITSVTLPDCIETISVGAFASCRFTEFHFPSSLRYIGDSAFADTYLKNVILPDGVETLMDACFCGSRLETISLPNSLMELPINCFADCVHLKTLVIPNNVRKISGGAVARCEALESITLGKNVTDISRLYFCSDSPALKNITCLSTYPPKFFCEYSWVEEQPFSTQIYLNANLIVPQGSIDSFKSIAPWNNFQNITEKDFSGIELVDADKSRVIIYYNLSGQKSKRPFNGVNIIVYSDGSVRKSILSN